MGCDTSRKLPYQYECGLPSDINNVDVEFFNLLLKDNKVTSAKMEEVMVPDPQGEGEVKDGGGASGSGIKRYILEYATINKEDTIQQPKSLILKYSNILEFDDIGFGARAVWGWVLKLGDVQARMVKNEHVFYDKYSNQAKKDWGVDVPHCYKSLLYDGTEPSNTAWVLYNTRVDRQHLVILEDLKDYKSHKAFQPLPSYDIAKAALFNISKLHGNTWGKKSILSGIDRCNQYKMAFGHYKVGNDLKKKWIKKNLFDESKKKVGQIFMERLGYDFMINGKYDAMFKCLHENYEKISSNFIDWSKSEGYDECIVHGDFHHWNNMFHKEDPNKVMLVDWQIFGTSTPVLEIAYFTTLSLSPDKEKDYEMLQYYWDCLLKHGGTPTYDFNRFKTMCQYAFLEWLSNLGVSLSFYNKKLLNDVLKKEKTAFLVKNAFALFPQACNRGLYIMQDLGYLKSSS